MKLRAERKAFSSKPRKQNWITRQVNQWFDRVVGAMKGDGLAEQEAIYGSHQTTRDFLWNSIGTACWSFVFPVVTMVSTQLVGVEQAGSALFLLYFPFNNKKPSNCLLGNGYCCRNYFFCFDFASGTS